MTQLEARKLQEFGKDEDIEVQADCQGSVWCVSFRDVTTTTFLYAFKKLIEYGQRRRNAIREHILMVA
jgi:hypothetical protein